MRKVEAMRFPKDPRSEWRGKEEKQAGPSEGLGRPTEGSNRSARTEATTAPIGMLPASHVPEENCWGSRHRWTGVVEGLGEAFINTRGWESTEPASPGRGSGKGGHWQESGWAWG